MTTTDLKPGDLVQHPEHGFGFIVLLKKDLGDVPASEAVVRSTNPRRNYGHAWDLTGWERVETCTERERTILDIYQRVSRYGYTYLDTSDGVVMERRRADEESTAQRAESTSPADEQVADEQPANATVTLPCPDCGEPITNTAMVEVNREGERYLDFCNVNVHTCPPAQPDEPTLFGARIIVTDDLSGKAERWCRQHDGYWANEDSELMTWAYLTQRGAVTIGWSVEHD